MSSEVKRYKLRGSMPDTATLFLPDEVVSATDYAALEDGCERLRVKLMVIASAEPARHGIEWAKAIAAEGNGEPYAKWREAIEERDALAAELAAIKGREPVAWIVPDFGFLFPTEDAAQRYLRNINDLRKPTALYTLPAAPEGGEV